MQIIPFTRRTALFQFSQTKRVQFRLCPRDEVNTIDGEEVVPVVQEVVPMVEELVPIETLNPDRVDGTGEYTARAQGDWEKR